MRRAAPIPAAQIFFRCRRTAGGPPPSLRPTIRATTPARLGAFEKGKDMRRIHFAAAALLVLTLAPSARAEEPVGTWLTEGGKSRIRIADCGGALCGTIAWLQEPNDPDTGKPKTDKNNSDASKRGRPLIGVQIVLAMKPAGEGKWAGQVYNAEDGKTYSGNLTFTGGNSLQLQGCALGGLVCKGQTWTKAN